ncbi:MAG: VOC family protein [Chloroflexota bacterium]
MISAASIFSINQSSLADFYSKGLGLGEPMPTGPDHLGFQLPNMYLGFDVADREMERPGAVSLWFAVDDLAGTYQHLLSLGATDRYGPTKKPWGATLAAVLDPEGNVIGLTEREAEI